MADMVQTHSQIPPLTPTPSQLTGNSDPATPHPNTRDEATGGMDNSPKSNGVSAAKASNRKIQDLRSSASQCPRRSPRLVENAGGDSTAEQINSAKLNGFTEKSPPSKKRKSGKKVSFFIGDPIPEDEARRRWPWRYEGAKGLQNNRQSSKHEVDNDDDEELVLNIKSHYSQAEILKNVFDLGDCAYIKGPKGGSNYIGKILEFFETTDGEDYFRVQWFFRAEDTVIKDDGRSHDKKRLFYSTLMNDNLLDCIVSKVKVVQIAPNVNLKEKSIPPCDFYFDMKYSVDYSTFSTIITDDSSLTSLTSPPMMSTKKKDMTCKTGRNRTGDGASRIDVCGPELALLDMYSGCGGMSTGLCLGTKACGVDLVTRWAADIDKAACESLKLNHPETQIRNESAEDLLDLLKEWDCMCKRYGSHEGKELRRRIIGETDEQKRSKMDHKSSDEYEVEKLVDICYGDPSDTGKRGLKFKVRWVGYGPSDDTWEPIESLRKCQDRIRDFRTKGNEGKNTATSDETILAEGDVAVICGGPPCQGISGYNRFRNVDSPLDDERNRQIVIFMDIIDFLRPKFVLMENVIDILRFADGCLGRYAMSRLVRMHYQARLGIMAAGCYGLPQFRLRVFLWGAQPCEASILNPYVGTFDMSGDEILHNVENVVPLLYYESVLPQFPLPTHDVVIQYGFPSEFERNVVAYDEGQSRNLEKIIVLCDALSDLPPVANDEKRDKTSYRKAPETEFQKYIRAAKRGVDGWGVGIITLIAWTSSNFSFPFSQDMMGSSSCETSMGKNPVLYDHLPYPLNDDDHMRVCKIPKRKGANFRDLPGIIIGSDNGVRRAKEPNLMPSGKPWVPDYAINFRDGKSTKPFGRLWWDETVPTVFCFPDPHMRAVLHPEQDRLLTLRECARLQGFHDYYKFCGKLKERYSQVGNAVAVSVGRALGYSLGMAVQKLSGRDEHLMTLPPNFSHSTTTQLQSLLNKSEQ
ncbi:DNA (cytosine-5)-methyltransferase CMT2 [Sesamum angolense]|uniref:DNA (cytosine-5-)-methyltransferase n=1 Tax=Sesamum angolense TaxID=2727404 RepID=A0AAE1VZC1_9LAMI|nr:DNA (cytosine-5)-methyltransferase CMT2 [Sesamum angolense]